MPAIQIPDDTYQKLVRRAEALGTTVEALVAPALEQAAAGPPAPVFPGGLVEGSKALTGEAWVRAFEAFNRATRAEAGRYPPGFRVDDSREAIYGEGGA